MSRLHTPSLQIRPDATVRKLRELPVRGTVTAALGQAVASGDIIAQADQPGELRILRVPEAMGIEPQEAVEALRVREGDRVKAGDLLCERAGLFGLFKSRFISPDTGTIEFITARTGHIGLRLPPNRITLDAYISGVVSEINEGKSCWIETRAVFVQGIFGVGGERKGRLRLFDLPPDQALLPGDIPPNCKGEILVGGTRPSFETLDQARANGATGFITGSIDDRALAAYLGFDLGIALTGDEDLAMSLIVTEGFGNLPISDRILELLKPLEGAQASINGATQVRAGAVRPELIVSHQDIAKDVAASLRSPTDASSERVRIIRVPYFGQVGEVVELPSEPQLIETGAHTRVMKVRLASGEVVTVPRANVEVI